MAVIEMVPLIVNTYRDDYKSLVSAIEYDDFNLFCNALRSKSISEDEKSKVFELACKTPGRAQYIRECISAGCDVNKLNVKLLKRPIDFVVESNCEENVAVLLGDPRIDLSPKCVNEQAPLNCITEQISDENFSKVFPCIKLLTQHSASKNLLNKNEFTPIKNIVDNWKLNPANKEQIVRHFELPNNPRMNKQWDFIRLFFLLKKKQEDEFLKGLALAEKNPKLLRQLFTATVGIETLLIVAIREDLIMALERMIQLGDDIVFLGSNRGFGMSPVCYACSYGYWKSLEILLKSPQFDVNSVPLLYIVLRNFGNKIADSVDYEKCFEILINHPDIDVNLSGHLDLAAMTNNSKPILELLKRGAYIGERNSFRELSISYISANILEAHFDSCITTNGFRSSKDNFAIDFNFKNLIPSQTLQTQNVADIMSTIGYISKSNELKHLTMHPLIASFLALKWNRLAPIFYVNFFFCAFFATITTLYILLYYNYNEQNHVLRAIIFLLTIYIAAREIYQFISTPCIHIKSLDSYLESILVVFVMLIIFDVCPKNWRRTFAATSILFTAIEIFLLAGSLPFWSFYTHYVMLRTVTWSFLKSLSLYAIILLAFSFSFFTLLHEPSEKSSDNTKGENGDDGGGFNKFSNVGLSIMKTLVMSTGEFDADSIDLKTNTFNYIIFTIFVFIVTIVLFNLLNGLAVSDTHAIKSQAELTNFIRRAQVLARYEKVLATSYPIFFEKIPFCAGINTFEDSKSFYNIRVKPNDNNRILIHDFIKHADIDKTKNKFRLLLCYNRCARMDSKIVELAFQVLEKKAKEKLDEEERAKFSKQITKMETTLETIAEKLNELLKK